MDILPGAGKTIAGLVTIRRPFDLSSGQSSTLIYSAEYRAAQSVPIVEFLASRGVESASLTAAAIGSALWPAAVISPANPGKGLVRRPAITP